VELIAAADADLVLTSICVGADTSAAYAAFEIDIATGAPASETVVTTFRGVFKRTYFCGPGYMPCPIPLDNIATGARVSARLRKSNTRTDPWTVSMSYYKKAITGTLLVTAKPQKCFPSAAASFSVPLGAGTWANSSWSQMIASTATAIVLVGVSIDTSAFSYDEFECDLGIGAAASEVVFATFKTQVAGPGGGGGPNFVPINTPYDSIASSSRIAVRGRAANVSFREMNIALSYIEKPL
jgi:hypothetical protein